MQQRACNDLMIIVLQRRYKNDNMKELLTIYQRACNDLKIRDRCIQTTLPNRSGDHMQRLDMGKAMCHCVQLRMSWK